MVVSDQFDKVDFLLLDIKHKCYVVELIIEEKLEPLRGREIDEDEEDEVWESFLTHFYNDLSHFKNLSYYLPKKYPAPEISKLDIDLATVNFKFFVTKYDLLLRLMHELSDEVLKVSVDLVAHHPFQEWKKLVIEKVDEFGENADYFHEHL